MSRHDQQIEWDARVVEHIKRREALEVEIAAKRVKLEKLREQVRIGEASAAIKQALERAGCLRKYLKGATALLVAEWRPEIQRGPSGELVVVTPGADLDWAVRTYLASDEGSAFMPPKRVIGSYVSANRPNGRVH